MDERKQEIFHAIVRHFIQTATPVGSNTILVSYKLSVSPATIRNDMVFLEHEGLLYQPHTSAGRIPTDLGYRMYVNNIQKEERIREKVQKDIHRLLAFYRTHKAKEHIYDAVGLLADSSNNVSFATLPDQSRTFYLGLSHILKQPEFRENPMMASQVVEVFEHNNNFLSTLHTLDITDDVKIFIGKENIIEKIQSCSLIVSQYNFEGHKGFIGILGPTRMNYAYCTVALEEIKKILEKNKLH
ncbi:DeoR family transcriptional regulator [Candidatus Peregrinibacteria bacterium]|nr:DeoR family transcriptional regulator [Candidatus Peregrinibacteria bacterium]